MHTDSQTVSRVTASRTSEWRSAAGWGRGHGRALVGVKGRQTGRSRSLRGAGWRGRGAARRSPRWRWWRRAGRSCGLGDPGISLLGKREVGWWKKVSGVSVIIEESTNVRVVEEAELVFYFIFFFQQAVRKYPACSCSSSSRPDGYKLFLSSHEALQEFVCNYPPSHLRLITAH